MILCIHLALEYSWPVNYKIVRWHSKLKVSFCGLMPVFALSY
nr:MAG TPA: hypothetical protein [Caudoviricetes sp.]